jgi:hypothetical protein
MFVHTDCTCCTMYGTGTVYIVPWTSLYPFPVNMVTTNVKTGLKIRVGTDSECGKRRRETSNRYGTALCVPIYEWYLDKYRADHANTCTQSHAQNKKRHALTCMQSVLRIRDVYPGSRILIFTHPGSRIQKQQQKRGVTKNLLSYLFL